MWQMFLLRRCREKNLKPKMCVLNYNYDDTARVWRTFATTQKMHLNI